MTRDCKPRMAEPHLASSFGYAADMNRPPKERAAEVLAANVQRLMDFVGEGTQTGLEKATKVPQKTISRVLNQENSSQLATIEDLARGAGLEPWQLLVPGLDPKNPPKLL